MKDYNVLSSESRVKLASTMPSHDKRLNFLKSCFMQHRIANPMQRGFRGLMTNMRTMWRKEMIISILILLSGFHLHSQSSYDLYGMWSKRSIFGSGGSAYILSTEVDENKNIYVAGYFTGTLNFSDDICNPEMRTATGGEALFLIKYNNLGQYQWDIVYTNLTSTTSAVNLSPLHYDNGRILFTGTITRRSTTALPMRIQASGNVNDTIITSANTPNGSFSSQYSQWFIQVVDAATGKMKATITDIPTGVINVPSPHFFGSTIVAAHFGWSSLNANASPPGRYGATYSSVATFQLINNDEDYTVSSLNTNYPNQPLGQHPSSSDGSRVTGNITIPNGNQIFVHCAQDYSVQTGGNGVPAFYVMSYSNNYTFNNSVFISDRAIDGNYRPIIAGDDNNNVLVLSNFGHSKFWNTQSDIPNSNFINNYMGSGLDVTTNFQYNKIALAKVDDNLVYNSFQGSWVIQIGTAGTAGTDMVYGSDMKIVNDVIYITGRFKGTNVPFGNGKTLTSNGANFDGFYAAYDNNDGTCLYAVNMGGVNDEEFSTVYLTPDAKHVLICGTYNSPIFQTDPAARLYSLSSNGTTSQGFMTWYTVDPNEPATPYDLSLGDAPLSYGVAVHHAYQCVRLGGLNFSNLQSVPQHSVNANTALNDDGIAISFTDGYNVDLSSANFNLSTAGHLTAKVTVYNSTLDGAKLIGWIDFNKNGVFDGASEASGVITVNAGEMNVQKTLTWSNANTKMLDGTTYMRLRITTDGMDQTQPQGLFFNGEAEDYRIDFNMLNVEKSFQTSHSNPATANIGDTITYSITLTNNILAPINNITLFDTIPGSTSYVANSAMKGSVQSGSLQPMTINGKTANAVVWPTFNLAAGATSDTYSFKVVLDNKPIDSDTIYNLAGAILNNGTVYSNIVNTGININITICSGEIVTLNASLTTPGLIDNPVYKWYDAPTGGNLLGDDEIFTTSTPITSDTVFYISLEGDNYCVGTRQKLNILVEDCSKLVDDYTTTFVNKNDTIPVLDNDIYPSTCEPGVVPVITSDGPFVTGASAKVHGRNIVYIPAQDFVGRDSIIYKITCAGVTDSATVYINVIPYPDNIGDVDCYTDPPATAWSIVESTSHNTTQTLANIAPVLVGDLDGDGLPEVVSMYFGPTTIGANWIGMRDGVYADNIVVYRGPGLINADTIRNPDKGDRSAHDYKGFNLFSGGGIALGKPNNTSTEAWIYAIHGNRRVYAFDIDGNVKWSSNVLNLMPDPSPNSMRFKETSYDIGIADFNNDGISELYCGPYILNARTGDSISASPGNHGLHNGFTSPTMYLGKKTSPFAADIDGDGTLEYIAGNEIYKVNISTGTMSLYKTITPPADMPNITDGKTQVADIDMDGHLDIIISNTDVAGYTANLWIWSPHRNMILSKVQVAARHQSLPFIGDIDGDGKPEILFVTSNDNYIWAFKYVEGNPLLQEFWKLSHSDPSGMTGITLFDFNQDGISEIVYRDVNSLRIIDGSRKIQSVPYNMSTFPCYSGTGFEYPVIADIDNDGSAEILVNGHTSSEYQRGPLRIFKSGGSPWAPARPVWNQYSYNAVNVNNDLSIPQYQLNPATVFPGEDGVIGTADDVRPYNNFLQQQTMLNKDGMPLWIATNAVFDYSLSSISTSGNDVIINACFKNIGDAPLGSPIFVTIYSNSVSTSNILAMDSVINQLMDGESDCISFTIPDIMSIIPLPQNIIVRVNDRNGVFAYQPECDTTDNVMPFINPFLMKKSAKVIPFATDNGTYPNPVSVLGNEVIEYTITAENPTASAMNVTITDSLPAYLTFNGTASAGYTQLANTTPPPYPAREVLRWSNVNVPANNSASVTFEAIPQSGAVASQPLFINSAWVTAPMGTGTIDMPTNSTYHQGAGISIMTFSAGYGGSIYNAGEQALDYMSTPRSGVLIAPDEGYAFAGWSHSGYTSLRGAAITAQKGIMLYDTLTVYGNVELHANFEPIEESLEDEQEEVTIKSLETDDKAWTVDDELYIRTNKASSIVRIYSLDGVLRGQHTIIVPGITTKKLPRGIYIVTINGGLGQKVVMTE